MHTIAPASALPAITSPVLIDGTSQPGYASSPLIELSGSQAGDGDGLDSMARDITVRGLDINGFSSGGYRDRRIQDFVPIAGDVIAGNFLGTDPTGTQALPNRYGVQSSGPADNLVGGATPADGNLIAFNTGPGVVLGTLPYYGSSGSNRITLQPHFRQWRPGHRPGGRRDHRQLPRSPPGTEQPPEFPDHRRGADGGSRAG